ncbi:hypothetical protein ACFS27_23800 [Promicromonospora vindobonensis]|uniref:DUF2993 domain-containing protein n=1 Tax=Promicromonospora vindobonensis TaxID=195748 RepID=A0ABW5VYM5_9MICO
MTESAPRRPRRRWIIAVASVVGGLVVLGVLGELVLRYVIDDRIESAAAELPPGMSVARDDTPALWQVATGRATLRVEVPAEALNDAAREATDLPDLEVAPAPGGLVARFPLPVAGDEQTVDMLLSVTAEDGRAVLRADSVQLGGLTLPVSTLADQLGVTELDRLAEGVQFPEGESPVAISSAQATEEGLELGAEVAMW